MLRKSNHFLLSKTILESLNRQICACMCVCRDRAMRTCALMRKTGVYLNLCVCACTCVIPALFKCLFYFPTWLFQSSPPSSLTKLHISQQTVLDGYKAMAVVRLVWQRVGWSTLGYEWPWFGQQAVGVERLVAVHASSLVWFCFFFLELRWNTQSRLAWRSNPRKWSKD